ncbi:MAG: hypothetical protein AAGI30_07085 [Planctomycetota bacterium]
MAYRAGQTSWVCATMRVVWSALAAVHVVPLVAVGVRFWHAGSMSDVGSCLVLGAIVALFVLKACDVAWLRMDRPVLEVAVWLIAGAIAHGPSAAESIGTELSVPLAVVAVGGVVLAGARVRRRFFGWWTDFAGGLAALCRRSLFRSVQSGLFVAGDSVEWCQRRLGLSWSARPPPAI